MGHIKADATKIHLDDEEEYNPLMAVICAGPERCFLTDEDAKIAQLDGCVWCSRLYKEKDGREIVIEPGEC